jgi:hypothetical protein
MSDARHVHIVEDLIPVTNEEHPSSAALSGYMPVQESTLLEVLFYTSTSAHVLALGGKKNF